MPAKSRVPVEEPRDGDLVGGDQGGRRALADPTGLAGDPQRREAGLVGCSEVEPAGRHEIDRRPTATGGGRDRSGRTGSGVRMSGVPSWALREPSTKRTAEWTTLCGWITTSIAS